MGSEELFAWAGIVLLAGAVLSLPGLARQAAFLPKLGRAAAAAGLLLILAGLLMRWRWYAAAMDIAWLQAFPVSTLYESIIFFSGVLAAAGVLSRASWSALLWAAGGIAILAASLSAVPSAPVLFMPSLKSSWLVAHVSLSFAAYALYAAAALLGAGLAVRPQSAGKAEAIRSFIRTATLIFTVGGLIFGAVWAHESWGRFWAWDPKETWAFITWSAYCLLHLDCRGKLSPRALAIWAVVNFGIVLFTYFGVSLLFAGLHSDITL